MSVNCRMDTIYVNGTKTLGYYSKPQGRFVVARWLEPVSGERKDKRIPHKNSSNSSTTTPPRKLNLEHLKQEVQKRKSK